MASRVARTTAPRGYFGMAVWMPKHESNVGSLWRTADSYGAAFLGTVGRRYRYQAGDTTKASNHTPLIHYTDLDDLIAHLPHGCALIGVELDPRAIPLDRFAHPQRALYLLGAEDHGLPQNVIERCHHLVEVPAVTHNSLNVSVAGGIVAAHRYLQLRRTAVTV